MDVTGTVALVTGAGSGIGRATCVALSELGAAQVHLVDIDADAAQQTARAMASSCEPTVHQIDLADIGQLADLFERIDDGALHICFNNAGVNTIELFPETPPGRMARSVAINLTSLMYITQEAARLMAKSGGGAIVNTSSAAALVDPFYDVIYAALKAGVLKFSQLCGGLEASHGVRVMCLLPGLVDTPMIRKQGDALTARLGQLVAEGKAVQPEDIVTASLELVRVGKAGDWVEIRR